MSQRQGAEWRKPDVCQPTGSAELAMLDVYMPMMKTAAIVSAGRLGLFEALSNGPLTVAALAEGLASSQRGLSSLCDFLVTLGYLRHGEQGLENTESTQRWFTSKGTVDYTPGLLWTHEAWPMMQGLAACVQRGGPEQTLWEDMQQRPILGDIFSRYMAAFAGDLGPDLLRHVPVAARYRRLLDLGGSHGLHSIRFCQHYPDLQSTIVDLPSALGQTAGSIAARGLSERIRLQPGDLQSVDWGGEHDLVFYLSVAHNHTAEDNARIFKRIADSLSAGGLLVIHEYIAETPPDALNAAFRLTLLLETGTETHRWIDYQAWLQAAGFARLARIDLDPLEKGSLILAYK